MGRCGLPVAISIGSPRRNNLLPVAYRRGQGISYKSQDYFLEIKAMITGSIVAIVTPMHEDGSLDLNSLRNLVDFHVRGAPTPS